MSAHWPVNCRPSPVAFLYLSVSFQAESRPEGQAQSYAGVRQERGSWALTQESTLLERAFESYDRDFR